MWPLVYYLEGTGENNTFNNVYAHVPVDDFSIYFSLSLILKSKSFVTMIQLYVEKLNWQPWYIYLWPYNIKNKITSAALYFTVFYCGVSFFLLKKFLFDLKRKILHSSPLLMFSMVAESWTLKVVNCKPEDTWVGEHQCGTTAKKCLLLLSISFLTDSKRSETQRGRLK